jgi:hypothetical protein
MKGNEFQVDREIEGLGLYNKYEIDSNLVRPIDLTPSLSAALTRGKLQIKSILEDLAGLHCCCDGEQVIFVETDVE